MSISTGKRKAHLKSIVPADVHIKAIKQWSQENREFLGKFSDWLRQGGYGFSAIHIYSGGARIAIGLLDKPVEEIDIERDFRTVQAYIETRPLADATIHGYRKGLNKLAQYLRMQRGLPEPGKIVNWGGYLREIPGWLVECLRAYVEKRSREWRADRLVQHTRDLLSRLCGFFRAIQPDGFENITPKAWFAYLGGRMTKGLKPASNNLILHCLKSFLRFVQDTSTGQVIDQRMLKIRPQKTGKKSPCDMAVPGLKAILTAASDPFDRGWLLLMLHGGLRTCEIRRLKWDQVDFEHRAVRIEASKNLKNRVVPLTKPALDTLKALPRVSEFVFSHHHRPLSRSYCQSRLKTMGKTCNVKITPHQLRHSLATLLLNNGMSIWGVKEILGHKYVDTTLGYARTFDDTVEKEYRIAINSVCTSYGIRSIP